MIKNNSEIKPINITKITKGINNTINYINIAYAFDNIYYYITHVSMKSIMLNQNENTFIKFFILVHESIYNEQKEIIDKICYEHINCNISYILMKDEFKEISPVGVIKRTTAMYYRLLLQNLIPNEKKILYLDCDTIIYKDLNEVYNYDITDKYYTGEKEGSSVNKYINTGALLVNLEYLRKDNISQQIYDYLKKNNNTLILPVQDAISAICNKKIGIFPENYISHGICDSVKLAKIIKEKENNPQKIKDLKEPYIFHFKVHIKPWLGIANNNDLICYDFFPRFYEYAKKTCYYYEILEKFKVTKDKIFIQT